MARADDAMDMTMGDRLLDLQGPQDVDDDSRDPEDEGSRGSEEEMVVDEERTPNPMDTEKMKIRAEYRDIQKVIGSGFQDLDLEKVNKIVKKADRIFDSHRKKYGLFGTRESLCDAQVLKACTEVSRKRVNELQTGSRTFNAKDFANKMAVFLTGEELEVGEKGETLPADIDKRQWSKREMMDVCGRLFDEAPRFSFLYGSFDPGEVMPKVRKVRAVPTHGRRKAAAAVVPRNIEEGMNNDGKMDSMEVEELYGAVCDFCENEQKALGYFPCIIDPNSFSNTVQNMFAVSFLVKGRRLKLFMQDELPFIEPVADEEEEAGGTSGGGDGGEERSRKQVVVSFTRSEWKEAIETFRITDAFYDRGVPDEDLQHYSVTA